MIVQAPHSKVIVAASGFSNEETVESSHSDIIDNEPLEARHEETDTRIVLNCVKNLTDKIVVQCRDTDVIALLLGHFHRMTCTHAALVQNGDS